MGVINITPDSFSDGGQFLSVDDALFQAEKLIQEGADLLDVGAESSRPGSDSLSVAEELDRLTPFLNAYFQHFDTPLSLDTYKSEVAAFGLEKGVAIINDIKGLQGDPKMAEVIAAAKSMVIAMHMQHTPKIMQALPQYDDVVDEVSTFLKKSVAIGASAGIQTIIVDPGIGFGKTLAHNVLLLKNLEAFNVLGPVLVGTSKKSFIHQIDGANITQRSGGTVSSNLWAYTKGCQFFRVHDVAQLKQAIAVWEAISDG